MTYKKALEREELRDVIDLSLWAGQLLLQHGAEAERVEETVHRLGTALGCDWLDVLVSPNAIIATTSSGLEFRTKVRRVVGMRVDMTIVSAVNRLSRRVESGELNRFQARAELARISSMPPHYNRWLTVALVGLACASFSRLFGGDWAVFAVTFAASATAMLVRQELTRRHINQLLTVIATAFVAGLIASSAAVFRWSETPLTALSAAVLLLVPGVPLINAAEDMIKGHMVVGLVRGATGVLVSLAIALGLLLAMTLAGVRGL
ncbi:MAG: threonine/serine exporter family protein [Aggregatilineales bacterium]